jgi:hypothetical protein
MIKGLMGTTGITVGAGNTSVPYINQNMNNPMQGMLRINGNDMQVFDGSTWINLSTSYATIGLDSDVLDIVQWARKQRDKELEYKLLAKDHPAVQHAIDAIKRAEEQLELIVNLSKEHGEQFETS